MRKSEYVIDRLNAELQHYKDIANAYEEECKALHAECKFTAALALVLGLVLGSIAGTAWSWL